VTLVTLFATILLMSWGYEGPLGIVTALIFTVVLVHRQMRSSLGVSEELGLF